MEIVVGISGASGVQYGIRLLQVLKEKGCSVELIMTDSARKIMEVETDFQQQEVVMMADHAYLPYDFTAPIASGSYHFDAMVIVPCSMGTLAGVATGSSNTLITRAADVCLKEKRRLILVPRETPVSLAQLKNMVSASEAGAVIMPACPAFYSRPGTLENLIDVLVGRILDLLGIDHDLYRRWGGNAYNR